MSKKILVVDDNKDMVSVLMRRLKSQGYETASAENGDQALKMIQKGKFDLIILDIMMPVMDGAELGQILKNNPSTKNIPMVFLTALGTRQEDTGYSVTESNIVFAKPFDFKELAGKIDELIADRP